MERKTELQLNMIADARKKDLTVNQRTMDMQWLNSRMEDGRMGNCLALIQREAELEKNYQERTDHAALVNKKVARETALAYEIAKAQREETVAYQRRHLLRERDDSLRKLTKKLEAAYVCRDLQQQIMNNQYRKLQEKAEENKITQKLSDAIYSDKEYREVEMRNKAERANKYCQELQQQLVSRQRQKQCQYEDTLIEKKMLDDIMRTITDEDQREIEQKRELVEKTRQEMVTFKQAQEAWRAKQREIVLAEEKEIEKQQAEFADRQAIVKAERERVLKEREEANRKVAAEILADAAARNERDDIIRSLQEQEHLESNFQQDIIEREKRERVKRENMEALMEQMQIRKQQAAKEREVGANYLKQALESNFQQDIIEREKRERVKRENMEALMEQMQIRKQQAGKEREVGANYLKQMLSLPRMCQRRDFFKPFSFPQMSERENMEALMEQMQIRKQQAAKEREVGANYLKQLKDKMAEEEAKEAEKQRLVKEKNKQHCALLLKQAEEQRLRKIGEAKSDADRARATREYEQKWRAEVAKEREEIVREHVPKLLGYLQAGVIKKADLTTVREGANKDPELAKLNIEGLTLAKRPKRFAKCNAQCLVLREY
ncbi:hypothetical protein O0L34_g4629 [Tuta absoluta]|nr:hypothetical protein O0L34_g4629 [Tuta absoluta]